MRKLLMSIAAATLLTLTHTGIAHAQSQSSPQPQPPVSALADETVVVQVTIAAPPGLTRDRLIAAFRAAGPEYEVIPGLVRKYFTVSDAGFGGTYIWTNRAAAERWFTDAWRQGAVTRFGSQPVVTYYDAPVAIVGHCVPVCQ